MLPDLFVLLRLDPTWFLNFGLSLIKRINIPLAFINHSQAASCTWRDLPTDLRVGCRLPMT